MLTTQEILDRIDMAELLDQMGFDDVNRSSSTYLGFCIFHDDLNTKSFYANHTSKTFKCFGACVHGTSKVMTPTGLKLVKDVVVGDKILGRDGRYVNVEDTTTQIKKEHVTFRFANRNIPLSVTSEHPMMVLRGCKRYGRTFYKTVSRQDKLEKCQASAVVPGDFMAVPKPLLRDIKLWDISGYVAKRESRDTSGFRARSVPHTIEVDDDLLWLRHRLLLGHSW